MPPKRKRADNATETPPRVTRATSSATRPSVSRDAEGVSSSQNPESTKNVRNSKRTKTGATQKKAGKRGKGEQEKLAQDGTTKSLDDVPEPSLQANDGDSETGKRETEKPLVIQEKEELTSKSRITPVPSVAKYDPRQALALFSNYADGDKPDIIGSEGFEKICNDAQIPMDEAMGLILSWQLSAQEMAKLTKDAWIKETDALKVSSLLQLNVVVRDLNDLLILGRPPIERPTNRSIRESSEPYDRKRYWTYTEDPKAAFQELYVFSFSLVKPQQSRNIDMEIAVTLWSVLLVPLYPLMSEILAFIRENGQYKAANKDLWNMMLEFCRGVDTNLQGYDSDAAWPTLLDDFVAWKRNRLAL